MQDPLSWPHHLPDLQFSQEKGKGTTFDIHLPASKKEVTKKEKKLEDNILKGTETILLVDDEDMILNVGKDMLRGMGYNVLLARIILTAMGHDRGYRSAMNIRYDLGYLKRAQDLGSARSSS